jgi:ABC-type polysaccharide/polyol phosphate transport system ATPase subunit
VAPITPKSAKSRMRARVPTLLQMYKMSKQFGKGDGSRPVLKDISLSFYPGVKIGVLGGNGAGEVVIKALCRSV